MQVEPIITKKKIPDNKLMCTAKHYVVYRTPIAGLNLGPNNLGPRDLRDLHLYPFKKVIQEANIYCVMRAYNEVNGIPMPSNKYLNMRIGLSALRPLFEQYLFTSSS